jgi:hypothetical protein
MNGLNVSWTLSEGDGGNMDEPDWQSVKNQLRQVLCGRGTVTLEGKDGDDMIRSLQVRADNFKFVVTFGMETENDWIVRSYHNPKVFDAFGMVSVLGDQWHACQICEDDALIIAIFKEFFTTGGLSKQLLNP